MSDANDFPATFFRIAQSNVWGDYGALLIHGEATRKSETLEERIYNRALPLVIDRAGPHVPPLSVPFGENALVVTAAGRARLEQTHPGAFTFREAELGKVVWIDWQIWDFTSDLPRVLPSEGEPANYFIDNSHSSEAQAAIGKLWEIELEHGADMEAQFHAGRTESVEYRLYNWRGQDVFFAEKPVARMRKVFATPAGRSRLECLSVDPFVRFVSVPCKNG